MYELLFIIGLVCAIVAGIFLAVSVILFFAFNIPSLRKDMSGSLQQKQIEEIRKSSSDAINRRRKGNVFEELERTAKVKKHNTHSLNVGPTTDFTMVLGDEGTVVLDEGTVVLDENAAADNAGFTIEKDTTYVSTTDVI